MPFAYAVVGGDARLVKLAGLLTQENALVRAFGQDETPPGPPVRYLRSLQETVADCDMAVLPIPLLRRDGALNMPLMAKAIAPQELLQALPRGCVLAAGLVPPDFRSQAESGGVVVVDYAEREDLAVKNAVPTAEGALQIAMEQMTITIHRCRALVIGYGRIGKILARYLAALGAAVTVGARSLKDHSWIAVQGYESVYTDALSPHLHRYDAVFNTVPHPVLGEALLRQLPKHCLLLDLASAPGGIDIDAAKRLGLHCLRALALPGKCAPDTAAANLRDTLLNIMNEKRVAL